MPLNIDEIFAISGAEDLNKLRVLLLNQDRLVHICAAKLLEGPLEEIKALKKRIEILEKKS